MRTGCLRARTVHSRFGERDPGRAVPGGGGIGAGTRKIGGNLLGAFGDVETAVVVHHEDAVGGVQEGTRATDHHDERGPGPGQGGHSVHERGDRFLVGGDQVTHAGVPNEEIRR